MRRPGAALQANFGDTDFLYNLDRIVQVSDYARLRNFVCADYVAICRRSEDLPKKRSEHPREILHVI